MYLHQSHRKSLGYSNILLIIQNQFETVDQLYIVEQDLHQQIQNQIQINSYVPAQV